MKIQVKRLLSLVSSSKTLTEIRQQATKLSTHEHRSFPVYYTTQLCIISWKQLCLLKTNQVSIDTKTCFDTLLTYFMFCKIQEAHSCSSKKKHKIIMNSHLSSSVATDSTQFMRCRGDSPFRRKRSFFPRNIFPNSATSWEVADSRTMILKEI